MIQHSPVSMVEYYISKLFSALLTFLLSIVVVFSVGHFVRGVSLPTMDWLIIALIILFGSLVFIAMGVLVSLLPSAQLMSVVGNIAYMALAVLGGLWFPLTMFPKWLQSIGKLTPSYQLMQIVSSYLESSTAKYYLCGHNHEQGGNSCVIGNTKVINCANSIKIIEI